MQSNLPPKIITNINAMGADYHRRRLLNLRDVNAQTAGQACEPLIGDYLAGQVIYNLGEYPAPFSLAPTEYDEKLLRDFAAHGVGLIQIHEEWNDSQRCLGADKFSSHDPEGLRRFIALVHSLGMKIILYISTGFFETTDPDFDPAWSHPKSRLVEVYLDYAECSPAHPGWRAYLLPRLERIINEYELDGLYNDLGYIHPLSEIMNDLDSAAHISPAPETPEQDAAMEDLLGLVLNMTHKHGGILKIHAGTKHSMVRKGCYDYLWVGEGANDLDRLRKNTKNLPPYVVPCPDMSRAQIAKEDDLYLHTVPFMRFPLRVDGRPVTGQRAVVPGMHYRRGEGCFWTRHMRSVWRRLQENPDAPPMFGWWDSSPGRLEGRPRWLHHFDLYRPMVTPGTQAWLDLQDCPLIERKNGTDMAASVFVNDAVYMVLANYEPHEVVVKSCWDWENRVSGETGSALVVPSRGLLYLRKQALGPKHASNQGGSSLQ